MAGVRIPVSTTHVISGAIMGLAQQEGFPQLDVALESDTYAWLITFHAGAAVASIVIIIISVTLRQ